MGKLVEKKQEYTSKDTSINKVNKIYKGYTYRPDTLILDYGGGKYDSNIKYMKKQGCTVLVYDPYNRSQEHNTRVMTYVSKMQHPQYIVCSNVLNVIKEDDVIVGIFRNIKSLSRVDTKILFTVYEGDRTGVGKVTTKGYQRNQKLGYYKDIISKYFNVISTKKGIIECELRK